MPDELTQTRVPPVRVAGPARGPADTHVHEPAPDAREADGGFAASLHAWHGVAIAAGGSVFILWLGWTGRLTLYVHPRYTVFTVVMAVAALVLSALALLGHRGGGHGAGDHEGHDHEGHGLAHGRSAPSAPSSRRAGRRPQTGGVASVDEWRAWAEAGGAEDDADRGVQPARASFAPTSPFEIAVSSHAGTGAAGTASGPRALAPGAGGTVVALVALVVALAIFAAAPVTTLSTQVADARQVNQSRSGFALAETLASPPDASGRPEQMSMADWATAVSVRTDPAWFEGARPTLAGFITPDPDDPDNVVVLTRFLITCCAMDAQPVGVPVHAPGWRAHFQEGDWIEGTGPFERNPSQSSRRPIVFAPDDLHAIPQPPDPYLS